MFSRQAFPLLVASAFAVVNADAAMIHDLKTDFTLASNPSSGVDGGWGYNETLSVGGGPVGPVINDWVPGDFGLGQPAWVGVLSAPHAGWAQIIQNPMGYDIQSGDVLTHAPTSIAWQASGATAGLYEVDISMWFIRPYGRENLWQLTRNNEDPLLPEVTFLTGAVNNANSNRAAPLVIPTFLVSLDPGDYVRLDFLANPGVSLDFVGVNFTLTAVPEASSFAMIAFAVAAAVAGRRRIRRN